MLTAHNVLLIIIEPPHPTKHARLSCATIPTMFTPTLTTTFPLPPLPPLTFPLRFPCGTVENPSSFHVVIGYASGAIITSIIVVSVVGGGVTPCAGGGIAAAAACVLAYKKRNGRLPDKTKYEKRGTKHETRKADGKATRTEMDMKR